MSKHKLLYAWFLFAFIFAVSDGAVVVLADEPTVVPPAVTPPAAELDPAPAPEPAPTPDPVPTPPAAPVVEPAPAPVDPAPVDPNPMPVPTPPSAPVVEPAPTTPAPAPDPDPNAGATSPPATSEPPAWKPVNPKPKRKTIPSDTKLPEEIVIIQSPGAKPVQRPPTPQELQEIFLSVWNQVGRAYIDPKALKDWDSWLKKYSGKLQTPEDVDNAIAEMVKSLNDRWTTYTSLKNQVEAAHQFKDGITHAGVDIQKFADGKWRIDGIVRNSSAFNTALRERDIVTAINGKPLAQMASSNEVSNLLTGKVGSKVSITLELNGKETTVDLVLKAVTPDKGDVELLPGNIAYIRLPSFESEGTANSLAVALAMLYQESGGELQGIILDLRNNFGGLVTEAVASCSLFIEEGVIYREKTRTERSVTETTTSVQPMQQFRKVLQAAALQKIMELMQNKQMVVLVNGSTMSASEILTGALKDNDRAHIIGVTTFGKGVGYQEARLATGGVLTITSLTYVTPKGFDLNGKGLEPHVIVENPRDSNEDKQLEAALTYFHNMIKEKLAHIKEIRDLSVAPQGDKQPVLGKNNNLNTPINWQQVAIKIGVPLVSVFATILLLVAFVKHERHRRNKNKRTVLD
jgi:carboxyl-terminal processing protease